MPVPLDEPLRVVELDERTDALCELLGRGPGPGPDALLLEGADEPLGAPGAGWLPHVGRRVFDPEPPQRPGEVRARVLGSPVVTERDAPGDVGSEYAEPVPDRVVDRLESGEPIPSLGHGRPYLGAEVVDRDEAPAPAVSGGVGH